MLFIEAYGKQLEKKWIILYLLVRVKRIYSGIYFLGSSRALAYEHIDALIASLINASICLFASALCIPK